MDYFMGIDIGTFESKGVLMDEQCRIVASCSTKHGMEQPREGWFEHDAEEVWWGDFCKISHQLLEQSGIPAREVACVGGSTLGSDCLPVDRECRPLRKAILYGIDARAGEEIAWLTQHYGPKRVKALFGTPIITGDVAPKILWIKNHEPEVYRKTYKFLTGASYLAAKLTGNYVVDQFLGQASFRPLYGKDMRIQEEECELYCRPDQLARAQTVTSLAGRVTAQAAKETGLAEGTPVITGTGDSTAESISVGVMQPGDMMLQFGSTIFLYCCTKTLVEDDRVRGNNFTVPGTFSVAAGTNAAGTLTRWYRDVMFPDAVSWEAEGKGDAFQYMLEGVEQVPPGSDGLITLPYFAGERTPINDPDAVGMIFGLKLKHTRAHLYRSALESVGYSIAQHVEVLREHDVALKNVVAVGGGTKNLPWMQIVADITGLPIQIPRVTIGASYGDALMAALAMGYFRDFHHLREQVSLERIIQPDPDRYQQYRTYLSLYTRLYQTNCGLMHQLPRQKNEDSH